MPGEFGPWPTVYGRFRVWRNAGVRTALSEGLIAEAARQGRTDLSLVGVDFTGRPPVHPRTADRKEKGSRGGRPAAFDAGLCRDRDTVERLINRLKDWHGIATRFDKTPESHLAGLELRASMIWPGDLSQTAG